MTEEIRLLVVDDSSAMQMLIARTLSFETQMTIAATANDGEEALVQIPSVHPDIVLLDLEMPGIGGLETIVRIRAIAPKLPILVFSSHTTTGAKNTLAALSRGANDYVTKPRGAYVRQHGLGELRRTLVDKINALAGILAPPSVRGTPAPPPPQVEQKEIEVVAMGASTGGPAALETILSSLNHDFPVPIVVVQHMPATFTSLFASKLARICSLEVHTARNDLALTAGRVYIAPGDHHLEVRRQGLQLYARTHQAPHECECRPSVNVLFRSIAETCPHSAIGIVLTGMGRDGRSGAKELITSGSTVIAQDKETSLVWGMPGAVAVAGYANKVLPLDQIATALSEQIVCPAAN